MVLERYTRFLSIETGDACRFDAFWVHTTGASDPIFEKPGREIVGINANKIKFWHSCPARTVLRSVFAFGLRAARNQVLA